MFRIRGLGYVATESPEYKVWDEIGPDVFAMQISAPASDGAVRLRTDDYDYRISVHPGEQNRLRCLGWELVDDTQVDAAAEDLQRHNVEVALGTAEECEERRVHRFVHFVDPGGIRHELFTGALQKFRSFNPARRHGGFVTGDQGLGHVVVNVPDPDAENAFLTEVLGFRLTDSVLGPFGRIFFFHINPRHHSIATTAGPTSLHHIMIQCEDINDVGIAHDLVTSRDDMPLTLTLGRHSTDQMLSFYVQTPTGFNIEYGWGGLRLDDTWVPTTTRLPAEIWGHKWLTPDADPA
jgi:extradiol dioxygenase